MILLRKREIDTYASFVTRSPMLRGSGRVLKCSICSYVTNKTTNLKYHVLKHTGEKPFMCSVCNRRFGHPSSLRRHILTHMSFGINSTVK